MTNKYYYQLVLFQKRYPELTFDNNGYQYLSREVQEKFKKEIDEISAILRETIKGFSKFNHFKPSKDGSFCVRCQYSWSDRFIGVGYFNINGFREFEEYKDKV